MRLAICRESALAAAFVAIVARLFIGLAVDDGAVHNGAWIAALLGTLPAIPLLLCMDRLPRRTGGRRNLALGILVPLLLLAALADSGLVLSDLVRSAGYLALDRVPPYSLAIPVCAALFWCLCRNGDAIGYGAMLWARLSPVLILIVALLQARHLRPEWLRPVLGGGWPTLMESGARAAGWFVPAAAVLLVQNDGGRDDKCRSRSALMPAGAALVAAALLLLARMMTPTPLHGSSWLDRLDAVLTNGRAPLYLQLPMVVLWYAGMLHLLTCEGFVASAMLQSMLPTLDGRVCSALVAIATGVLSASPLPAALSVGAAAQWGYVAAALLAALAAISSEAKGGSVPCG